MSATRMWLVVSVAAALCVACLEGAGPDEGLSYSQIVGSWRVAQFLFVSQADPGLQDDLLDAGVEARCTIGSENRYSILIEPPAETPVIMTGSVQVSSGQVVMEHDDEPGNPLTYSAIASTNTVSMVTADVVYDFGSGVEEPALLYLTLTRLSGVTAADLAGDWEASEFRFIRLPDQVDTVDVLSAGGSLFVTITSAGEYELAVTLPEGSPDLEAGIIKIDTQSLILYDKADPAYPEEFEFVLETSAMMLTGYVGFDFDGDDIEEDAIVDVTLLR